MFEKGFKQFLCRQDCTGVRDPIDQCVAYYFSQVMQAYSDYEIDAIHDFEMNHNRRPKVLIQTVAHISGAAYYYQRADVVDDPWPESQKICGVCVHPRYGGWFALRGVLIFKDVIYSDLQQTPPTDCVPGQRQRISLLEKFNFNWKDWTFRDVIEAEQKYTEQQKDYFATRPGDRQKVIEAIKNSCQNSDNS
ncbi:hypothetical protein FSP39_020157 [Pinctada imbricata]|uniref:Cyanocobalamin reductase (cyanide-eliminating) n=1 Tax=Pinctada imbricata TaxID=66713 RepID=A0AA89BRK3_PINIB|nr:hypothetical protein FSP39_020157 [Pinctada imbricata]